MRHLNGIDHMFWALETPTTTGVMAGLIRFDPAPEDKRPDAPFMRERISERLVNIPPMRWRLAKVPLGLDHSYLAETQRIDLQEHVRTVRLPAPGNDAQLAEEIGRLIARPLPDDRPLWELVVIEGLDDGSIAHLLRVHHVVLDGGSMPVLIDLLSDHPLTETDPSWQPRTDVEPRGGAVEMLARGLVSTATRPLQLARFGATMTGYYAKRLPKDLGTTLPAVLTRLTPGALAKPAAAVLNVRQRLAGAPEVKPLVPALRAPSTPFNKKVTANRLVAYAELPLAELKAVGKPFGYTLNDVVVAICAGALRRYLESHGGVPDKPLIVCVPVGLRDPKEPFRWANDVSMIFAEFPTHLSDPTERLAFAKQSVKSAKANFDEMPMNHYEAASRLLPPQTFAIPAKIMAALPGRLPNLAATWNVVVSNVRGPAKDIYLGGNRIRGIWPTSFLSPIGGVNITLQSYTDQVDFAIVACADHVDELDSLVGYMEDELELLKRLAATTSGAREPLA